MLLTASAPIKFAVDDRFWYLLVIAYAQMSLIIAHAGVLGEGRGPNFYLSLHLYPCFVHESSEVSGKSAHMCRLA